MMSLMGVSVIVLATALPVFDFATNSLAQRIVGADPTVCLSRYSDYPPSRGRLGFPRCLFQKPFPANEKFWLKDVDFSCASPWNESCDAVRAGTLISRRHVIFAKHFPLWKGVKMLFVDGEGEVCTRRVEATKPVERGDIMIGLLDREVAPSIHPAKILPEDYATYIGNGCGLPIVTFNQHEQAFLSRLGCVSTNFLLNASCVRADWKPLSGTIVGGDSGNPAFLLIGNEPILLYCLYSGGIGHGPSVFHRREDIQRAMDELCPGYRLESFDFRKVAARP